MGIQDSLSKAFVNWKRTIRDYAIHNTGFEGNVIRLKTTSDMYGDAEVEVISSSIINIALDIPDEIPLTRLRRDVLTPNDVELKNTFLYDIIPVRGYAKWADNVEQGDFLIHKIYAEDKNVENVYLWLLRVSEMLGSISVRHLTNMSSQCAPYNGALPQTVQDIIENYTDTQEDL